MEIKAYDTRTFRIPRTALREFDLQQLLTMMKNSLPEDREWYVGPLRDNFVDNAYDVQWISGGHIVDIK